MKSDPFENTEQNRYKYAGGDDGLDGIIQEVDSHKEYTTGNRDSAPPLNFKMNDTNNENEEEEFAG